MFLPYCGIYIIPVRVIHSLLSWGNLTGSEIQIYYTSRKKPTALLKILNVSVGIFSSISMCAMCVQESKSIWISVSGTLFLFFLNVLFFPLKHLSIAFVFFYIGIQEDHGKSLKDFKRES